MHTSSELEAFLIVNHGVTRVDFAAKLVSLIKLVIDKRATIHR